MRLEKLPRWVRRAAIIPLLILTLAAFRGNEPGSPADMVIRHARVYTVDEKQPWAEAVAVRGDRIAWVGSDADAAPYISATTKVVDAGGRLLLPGFVDSHFHVLLGGDPNVLRIVNLTSLPEIQRQVKEFSA